MNQDEGFVELFSEKWPDHELVTNPVRYPIDYSVVDKKTGQLIAMVEHRQKRQTIRKASVAGGVMVSLSKLLQAAEIFKTTSIPVQIFFSFLDCRKGQYYRFMIRPEYLKDCSLSTVQVNGPTGGYEREPVAVIPLEMMDEKLLIEE